MLLCHNNTDHRPGQFKNNGWVYTNDTTDKRCGVFVRDKPRSKPKRQSEIIYDYNSTQRTKRYLRQGKKAFCPQHMQGGQWVNGKGADHWPLYRQDKVIGQGYVVEFEGEKCAEIAAEGGMAAISHPGHAHSKKDERLKRYQGLKSNGAKEILIVADNDEEGLKRAAQSEASAREVGLWVQVIRAESVWPDIPKGGSIDDAPGSPKEHADSLKEAATEQDPFDIWGELKQNHNYFDDDENQKPLTYLELVDANLDAILKDQLDEAMRLRAELITRFRVTGSQVETALFQRQMHREAGGKTKAAPPSLDLRAISGMDYLIDGFIIQNDQNLIWGGAGCGKTTVAIGLAKSVIYAEGFLDHEHHAKRGAVLFIASDSGPAPLKGSIQDFGLDHMPEFNEGEGKRFYVWASDQNQGMNAWSADLQGCMKLLNFVKDFGITLVIIDSCKAVLASTDIEYTDNRGVTSLMTFFKEVICPHTTMVWLNHDGAVSRGPGCPAGAKAWKEIPSIVHHLTVPIDKETKKPVKKHREWNVEKNRLGSNREFLYQFADGDLSAMHGQITHGNCLVQLVEAMSDQYLRTELKLWTKRELHDVCQGKGLAAKTVDNTLSTAVKAKNPEICRRGRGKYQLAPRILDTLKKARSESGGTSSNSSSEKASANIPSTSRPHESGSSSESGVIPEHNHWEDVGKKGNPSHTNGSNEKSSHTSSHVIGLEADPWSGFAANAEVN